MKLRAAMLAPPMLALTLAACPGDDGSPPDAGRDGGHGADAGAPPDAGSDSGTAPDGGRSDAGPPPGEAVPVDRVTGRVVDEAGAPVEGARTQLCVRVSPDSILACLDPPETDAAGGFAIEVPADARCMEEAAMRVLRPGEDYAPTYCEMDLAPARDGLVEVGEPFVLYGVVPPTDLPPLGDGSAQRTVTFDGGLEVDVVPDRLDFAVPYDGLGARRIDDEPCFVAPDRPPLALWAFASEGPVEGDGFALRFPNAEGLAPGARVELLVLGGLDTRLPDGTLVPEADFAPFGTATVSPDGSFVESDDGGGLPYFSWVGYRSMP